MLHISDIRTEWPHIRDAVAKLSEGEPWRAEDVYAQCVNGKASLVMSDGAFMVCKVQECPYTGDVQLWIWAACSSFYGAIKEYGAELDAFARSHGAKTIRMASKRAGWQRVNGWTEEYSIYAREVGP
jgi:hypothetical protein